MNFAAWIIGTWIAELGIFHEIRVGGRVFGDTVKRSGCRDGNSSNLLVASTVVFGFRVCEEFVDGDIDVFRLDRSRHRLLMSF